MEYLEVLNDVKRPVGRLAKKGEPIDQDEHILVTVIFIENNEGKYLLQKRKIKGVTKYTSVGGHVFYKETSLIAIVRQIKTELGIKIDKNEIEYVGSVMLGIPFADIYYLKKNIKIDSIHPESDIEKVEYLSLDEIQELVNDDVFFINHSLMFREMTKWKRFNGITKNML